MSEYENNESVDSVDQSIGESLANDAVICREEKGRTSIALAEAGREMIEWHIEGSTNKKDAETFKKGIARLINDGVKIAFIRIKTELVTAKAQAKEYTLGKDGKVPLLPEQFSDHENRYFAFRVAANKVYEEKLIVVALPNITDRVPEVVGNIVVSVMPPHSPKNTRMLAKPFDSIDYVFVRKDERRKGIASQLWNLAEKILGRQLEHDPATKTGRKFAKGMQKKLKRLLAKEVIN